VKNRSMRAAAAISELQQWLVDDDLGVRKAARAGVTKSLYVAYTGDQNDRIRQQRRLTGRADLFLGAALSRCVDPDDREPWWASDGGVAAIRRSAIGTAFACAVLSATMFATGRLLIALVFVALATILDVFEGSFARVSGLRNAQLRWLSCVTNHAASLALLVGIALSLLLHESKYMAALVAASMLFTLFVSFVRVSALQAGYRYWHSPIERLVRWTSVGAYATAASAGQTEVGVASLAILLCGFGTLEVVRVIRGVERAPQTHGGLVLVNKDQTIDSWSFEDGRDEWLPCDSVTHLQ